MNVADDLARIADRVGTPKATAMPAKDKASPIHCDRRKWSPGMSQREPITTKNGAV